MNSAGFSPDSRFAWTASVDGTARVWSLVSEEGRVLPFSKSYDLSPISFSPDGTSIVGPSDDQRAE